MSAFRFDELSRRLLGLNHGEDVIAALEGVVSDRIAEAWDLGYARGVRDEAGDIERADNPFRDAAPNRCVCNAPLPPGEVMCRDCHDWEQTYGDERE